MIAEPVQSEGVRGYLHRTSGGSGDALVLTHGAGSNSNAPLLVEVAAAFAETGVTVLRCDLPFRQMRPHGPPFPAMAARDREGLRAAVGLVRELASGRVFLGGHSYGGRQASMAAAEDPALAAILLLLSYPLHPPRRPQELRTAHFPKLRVPSLFVHGSRDPFGSLEEMRTAIALIDAPVQLLEIDEGGHDLAGRRRPVSELARRITTEFHAFIPA